MPLPTDLNLAERELSAEFGLTVGMDLGAAYRHILATHRAVRDERDHYRDTLQGIGLIEARSPLEEFVTNRDPLDRIDLLPVPPHMRKGRARRS